MNPTTHSSTDLFRAPAAHSAKALLVGAAGSLALFIGLASAHGPLQERSAIVTLDPVVVSARREQLPTVFIHGRRDRAADVRQIAEL